MNMPSMSLLNITIRIKVIAHNWMIQMHYAHLSHRIKKGNCAPSENPNQHLYSIDRAPIKCYTRIGLIGIISITRDENVLA